MSLADRKPYARIPEVIVRRPARGDAMSDENLGSEILAEDEEEGLESEILVEISRLATEMEGEPPKASDHFAFEKLVKEGITRRLSEAGLAARGVEVYHFGGHTFPDIVIKAVGRAPEENLTLGVEVKSTRGASGADSVLGGSIMEGTGVVEFDKVHVFHGDLAANRFRFRRYRDVIASIKITHSPRYLLDFSLGDGENFFDRHGVDYLSPKVCQPSVIFNHYRDHIIRDMRSSPDKVWWAETRAESVKSLVAFLSELEKELQEQIILDMMVTFPSLLSGNGGSTKYLEPTKWLLEKYSVVTHNLRDRFSAGPDPVYKDAILLRLVAAFPDLEQRLWTVGLPNFFFILAQFLPSLIVLGTRACRFGDRLSADAWLQRVADAQANNAKGLLVKDVLLRLMVMGLWERQELLDDLDQG